MFFLRLCRALAACACLCLTLSRGALAEPRAAVVTVPAKPRDQPALSVGFDAAGRLFSATCAHGPCPLEAGQRLELPPDVGARVAGARLSRVRLGNGRAAVDVEIPSDDGATGYHAIFVAPRGGGPPRVVFAGRTGLVEGVEGSRSGAMVLVSEADASGARRIVVGEQREDLTLCGRPAILSPRLLHPVELELRPAKVQRLSGAERSAARRVTAVKVEAPRASGRLLQAVAASSAVGSPRALTDGDPETSWGEFAGGEGRGEFVLMSAPSGLPLSGFDLVIRPPTSELPEGAAPREFWLVSTSEVVHVTMPENAWSYPGARYRIELDPPLASDCLALVTESSFDVRPDRHTTFAELSALTEFDAIDTAALIATLSAGGPRADAAKAVLRARGQEGFQALIDAYDRLDPGGKQRALDAIDAAPCALSTRLYVRALVGPSDAQQAHARARLARCGPETAAAIEEVLPGSSIEAQKRLLDELVLVDPAKTVELALALLDNPDPEARRPARVALGRAAASRHSRAALEAALQNPARSSIAAIDLLRALGPRVTQHADHAEQLLTRIFSKDKAFRTRYLLLDPAARLAKKSARARAFVAASLASDASEHVRARAARLARPTGPYRAALTRALSDPAMRVRQAAAASLGTAGGDPALPELARLLEDDPWPLVRGTAARSLSRLPPNPEVDRALSRTLERDPSPHVRAPAIVALSERGARAHAGAIQARLLDEDEAFGVRAAAAKALGKLCDGTALDELTELALQLSDPRLEPEQRYLATAALNALAALGPSDLRSRLKPLTQAKEARIQKQVEAALNGASTCRRGQKVLPVDGARSRGR